MVVALTRMAMSSLRILSKKFNHEMEDYHMRCSCAIGDVRRNLFERRRFYLVACWMLILTLHPSSALPVHGQDNATEKTATSPSEDETPEAPKQVDVEPIARDEQIAKRLRSILAEIRNKTDWFSDTDASVADGVVFLSGEATDEEYRRWAGDLARNTEAVVAVVNRMTIRERSIWDMSPALVELSGIWRTAIQNIPFVLFGIIALFVTWYLAKLTVRTTAWATRKRVENKLLRNVLSKSAAIPVLILGVYIVLRVFDLTQLAITVVGGTGLAGLVIGIAFRDIAENLLASILLSIQNPFRSGDVVEIDSHLGIVQRVTTRGTVLMTFDGNHVQIPNSTVYKNTLINYSANPNRRVDFEVGIGYDDSAAEAQAIVMEELGSHPAVLDDPAPRVLLSALGAATVNLRVYFWVNGSTHNWETVQSSVMRIVKQSLLKANISLPDESREVIFPQGVPVRMLEQEKRSTPADAERERINRRSGNQGQLKEEVLSPAEGDLTNESDELKRQADSSWEPDGGTNLLTNGG